MERKQTILKEMTALIIIIVTICMAVNRAEAHRVSIFAWAEGDMVFSESKFSGGKQVINGKISVYNDKKELLLEGATNEHGAFSFKMPEKTALKIVLDAGMGHRAEWEIPFKDIEEPPRDALLPVAQSTAQHVDVSNQDKQHKNTDDIQLAMERALDKKLDPLIPLLIAATDQKTDVKDILGGIGYILGLMGVGSFFYNRQRNSGKSD